MCFSIEQPKNGINDVTSPLILTLGLCIEPD